jgi:uncharacterized protein
MDSTERQVIDELFAKIRQAESQSGPRDQQAEARIREHVAQQPASPYYMAQAIVIQEQALAAANARIEQLERQLSDRPAGGLLGGLFGTGGSRPAPAQPSRADGWDPRVAAYANPHYGRGGTGFLGGAMQTAMGVAGGVLLGSAIASMFTQDPATAAEEPPVEDAPAEDAPQDDFDSGGFDEDF